LKCHDIITQLLLYNIKRDKYSISCNFREMNCESTYRRTIRRLRDTSSRKAPLLHLHPPAPPLHMSPRSVGRVSASAATCSSLRIRVLEPSVEHQTRTLVVTCRVESNRHVFGPVLVYEKQATKQHPLWIECRIVGSVCTNVKGSLQLLHNLLPGSWIVSRSRRAFPSSSHCRRIG
jgi:hypothetical protein